MRMFADDGSIGGGLSFLSGPLIIGVALVLLVLLVLLLTATLIVWRVYRASAAGGDGTGAWPRSSRGR